MTPPTQQTDHRTRPWEIRYSSEYYSNALFGTYTSREAAVEAKHALVKRLTSYGFGKVASTVELN